MALVTPFGKASARARTTALTVGWITAFALLSGCASSGVDPAKGDAPPAATEPVPGAGYHQIMGEIAASRGATAAAAAEYLNAAERSDDAESSAEATTFAFAHGYDGFALRAARRWVRLAPEEPSAHLHLARLLLRRNDIGRAAVEAQLALGPEAERAPEDYALLADELAAEGNAEGITRVLTRILAATGSQGTTIPARLQLAVAAAALRSGDLDLARTTAQAALAMAQGLQQGSQSGLPPGSESGSQSILTPPDADDSALLDEASLIIARTRLARGDTAALADLQGEVEARPSLEFELDYVGLLAAAERGDEARARLDTLATRYGREPELRRVSALLHFNRGDTQAAWDEFHTLLDDPDYGDDSRFRLAEIAVRELRFDQALKFLGRIEDPALVFPAQEAIARMAEASGDTQSALRVLDELEKKLPERSFDVQQLRAALFQRLDRDAEALDVLNDILTFRPFDVETLINRGALLETMGRTEPALADMAAAVQLYPDSAITNNAYGYTLANRTGRLEEAQALVRRALEREPDSAAILDSYGWVLFRQKRLAEARSYLHLAYSAFPDPEVAAHLGEVMWRQGEREAARQVWEEALEKSPESAPLLETLKRFPK